MLLQSNMRSHTAVFVIYMIILPAHAKIYILHKLLCTSETFGVLFFNIIQNTLWALNIFLGGRFFP